MSDWQPSDWVLRQQPASPRPEAASGWRDLTVFWGYADLLLFAALSVPCLVAGFLLVQLFTLLSGVLIPGKAAALVVPQFIGYALWFLSLYFILRLRYQRPFWPSLGWNVPWPYWRQSLILGPALALSVAVLGNLLHTPNSNMPLEQLLTDRPSILLVGVLAATLGPLCEELAFRGFLLPLLVRTFGLFGGLLLSSLPFALLHGPQYNWHWQHIVLLTLASLAFGGIRIGLHSTAASTLTHATYNLTFFIGYLAQRKDFLP